MVYTYLVASKPNHKIYLVLFVLQIPKAYELDLLKISLHRHVSRDIFVSQSFLLNTTCTSSLETVPHYWMVENISLQRLIKYVRDYTRAAWFDQLYERRSELGFSMQFWTYSSGSFAFKLGDSLRNFLAYLINF